MQIWKPVLFAPTLGLAGPAFSQSYPEIDFSSRPNYLPNNVISLTFDDAPDWNHTSRVLDILRDKGVKASFFLNGENWSSLSSDEPMRELVRRMVREGHEIANHTSRHPHLGSLSPADIEWELQSVESEVQEILGELGRRLTLIRAPFGEPYQLNDPSYSTVAPVVARYGVHIGWNVDSFDYACGDGNCVINNVMNKIQTPGAGDYGVVLLHSVHAQTVAGLPGLIDSIRQRGFQFWSVEDVVRARYGKSSAELVGAPVDSGSGNPGTGGDTGAQPEGCDAPAWVQGQWYNIGDQVVFEGQVFTAQNEPNPGYHPKISYWFWKAGPVCN